MLALTLNLGCSSGGGGTPSSPLPNVVGTCSASGSLAQSRYGHTATVLSNGKVLVAGGYSGTTYLNSAELYDPATGTWVATGALSQPRYQASVSLLPNGKVLVAGGHNNSVYTATTDLYDPATGTFSPGPAMPAPRAYHLAQTQADGKVRVISGSGNGRNAEVFDPATNAFAAVGAMSRGHQNTTLTRLVNGKVLLAGGYDGSVHTVAELSNPATQTFTTVGSLSVAHQGAAFVALPNGKALVAGDEASSGDGDVTFTLAESFDPATGAFTTVAPMATGRSFGSGVLLPSGKVLVGGGGTKGTPGYTATCEIFDPATATSSATGSLLIARGYHKTLLLQNGHVLIVGGSTLVDTDAAKTESFQ